MAVFNKFNHIVECNADTLSAQLNITFSRAPVLITCSCALPTLYLSRHVDVAAVVILDTVTILQPYTQSGLQSGVFKNVIFAISDYEILKSCFVVVACQNHAELSPALAGHGSCRATIPSQFPRNNSVNCLLPNVYVTLKVSVDNFLLLKSCLVSSLDTFCLLIAKAAILLVLLACIISFHTRCFSEVHLRP